MDGEEAGEVLLLLSSSCSSCLISLLKSRTLSHIQFRFSMGFDDFDHLFFACMGIGAVGESMSSQGV